ESLELTHQPGAECSCVLLQRLRSGQHFKFTRDARITCMLRRRDQHCVLCQAKRVQEGTRPHQMAETSAESVVDQAHAARSARQVSARGFRCRVYRPRTNSSPSRMRRYSSGTSLSSSAPYELERLPDS